MKEFYDDGLGSMDAISILVGSLRGRSFAEKGCVELYYNGRSFDEGITLYTMDKTEQVKNGSISFLPYLNKDGSARLKVICCAVN